VYKFRILSSELNHIAWLGFKFTLPKYDRTKLRFVVLEDLVFKSFVYYSQSRNVMNWKGRRDRNENMALTFLPCIMKLPQCILKLFWGTGK
jgi:hypothetical protein